MGLITVSLSIISFSCVTSTSNAKLALQQAVQLQKTGGFPPNTPKKKTIFMIKYFSQLSHISNLFG